MEKRNIWIVGIIILLLIIGAVFFINYRPFVKDNSENYKGPYEEDTKDCVELNEDECSLNEKCFWYENCDYDPQSILEEDCILVDGQWQTGITGNSCLLRTQEKCEGLGYLWITKCDIAPAIT